MEKDFEENKIVVYLRNKNSSFIYVIDTLYNECAHVLRMVPKDFSCYTLHDITHSIRVINYMTKFVENKLESFSDLHLAMIIYAGLLHDTGMFVFKDEYEQLFQKIREQNKAFDALDNNEQISLLQDYVRGAHGVRVKNIIEKDYAINTSFRSLFRVGNVYNVSDVVATICQSHTEDCEWIVDNLNREMNIGNYEINPQHIAILLRIGDALDIDDRRAPWILYSFLNPTGVSDTEWKKHIPVRNYNKIKMQDGEYSIYFEGECQEPYIYWKIMDYLDWLNSDLKKIIKIIDGFDILYRFKIKVPLIEKIATNGFCASSFQFNIKYEQIVKLLMGENIYGSKKAGLREIVQNAIDATLLMKNIAERKKYINFVPCVEIHISKSDNQIIVFDNGTGMSLDILKEYFFNIGSSYYVSKEFEDAAYDYDPIGHFGIGFLSCFMLSSKITLETKHVELGESYKILFEKESPYIIFLDDKAYTFPGDHGTRIILEYDQIIGEVFDTEEKLIEYLKELLIVDIYEFRIIIDDQVETMTNYFLDNNSYEYISDDEVDIWIKMKEIPETITDCLQLVDNPDMVYYISHDDMFLNDLHETECHTVEYLYEVANDFDIVRYEYVKQYYQLRQNDYEHFLEYNYRTQLWPDKIYEFFSRYGYKIIDGDNAVDSLTRLILNESFSDNQIYWLELPIILEQDILDNYLNYKEKYGYEGALQCFENSIRRIYVFGTTQLSDIKCMDLCCQLVEILGNGNSADYKYFYEYPFETVLQKIDVIKHEKADVYLPVVHNYNFRQNNVNYRVYVKGIRIEDFDITLPFVVSNTNIESICVNLKSNKFETNVARNDLSADAKKIFYKRLVPEIYKWLQKSKGSSLEEKDLIEAFIDKYYC